jgi:uncharacterized protein (DUF4415 family)
MKALQLFTDDYLKECARMSPRQILQFLDDFRQLNAPRAPVKSRLISLKVDESLLGLFRARCGLENIAYQTQIKKLMRAWLLR